MSSYGGGVFGGRAFGGSTPGVGGGGRVPGVRAGRPRTKNPVNAPRAFGGTSRVRIAAAIPIVAADVVTITDTARISGLSTHLTASDVVTIGDAVSANVFVAPLPSLYKLMPGVGSRAHRRARGPANAPRYFSKSRPVPPANWRYEAQDSISIADAATRAAISQAKTAVDTVVIIDKAAIGLRGADAVTIADSTTFTRAAIRIATDTVSISDLATRLPMSYTARATDTVSLSDLAAGTRGRNQLSATDLITLAEVLHAGPNGLDSLGFSDLASASGIFFSGADSILISESVTGPSAFDRAFLYQFGTEVGTALPSGAVVYQAGTEVGTHTSSTAVLSQFGIEIAITTGAPGPSPGAGTGDLWWLWRRRHYRR